MSWPVYLQLSALWFFEFAVWGAWMPVLAARLMGPLKLSGKQTGWIYATLPLASMVSPLLFGHVADTWINTEWILAGCHLVGAVLLFVAAKQTRFWGVFGVMLLYTFFYAATLALVQAMVFRHMPADFTKEEVGKQAGWIFVWAPIGWAAIGYFLTGMRQLRRSDAEGRDAFYLAAVMSAILAVVCLVQPSTPPKAKQTAATAAKTDTVKATVEKTEAEAESAISRAVGMLGRPDYRIFIIVSLCVAGMMSFYFQGSAPFMMNMGIDGKNVSATMAIAQAVQAVGTLTVLVFLWAHVGAKWTLVIGTGCWTVLYAVYILGQPRWLIVVSQSFHGLAYTLFINGGWLFAGEAPDEIQASVQAVYNVATNGIGMFLGAQLAGFAMDRANVGGKLQWTKIWAVPLAITLAGAIALAALFNPPPPVKKPNDKPAAESTASAVVDVGQAA